MSNVHMSCFSLADITLYSLRAQNATSIIGNIINCVFSTV